MCDLLMQLSLVFLLNVSLNILSFSSELKKRKYMTAQIKDYLAYINIERSKTRVCINHLLNIG